MNPSDTLLNLVLFMGLKISYIIESAAIAQHQYIHYIGYYLNNIIYNNFTTFLFFILIFRTNTIILIKNERNVLGTLILTNHSTFKDLYFVNKKSILS